MSNPTLPPRLWMVWFLLVAVLVCLVWWLWPWYVLRIVTTHPDFSFEHAGQFGDLYGAFNALVSTFTLACLVYTLWQQQHDLVQTRTALRSSLNMQGLLEVRQVLQDEEVRQARSRVQKPEFSGDPEKWTADDWKTVERVCHTFEFAGILVKKGLLDRDLVFCTWGGPVERCWPKVCAIQTNRSRGFSLPYAHFQFLYEDHQRWKTSAPPPPTEVPWTPTDSPPTPPHNPTRNH
jgi:hypothetical protein